MLNNKRKDKSNTVRKLFFLKESQSPMAEAFRVLRTNLYFMNNDNECQVIVFTSSIPKEGKTTVAANYAVSTAINGKKTLLLDCDLKRPRIDNIFDLDVKEGLYSYLVGDQELDEVVVKERLPNLDIIPTRKSSGYTTELFHGKKFLNMIDEIKKKYDLIVIDTAPVGITGEAGIIAQNAHGVVVVCRYDMVNRKQLEYTKKHLSNAGANIYGVVVNRIDRSGYFYGSYSYYTDYYKYSNYYNQS